MWANTTLPDSTLDSISQPKAVTQKVITRGNEKFWHDAVERYEKRGPVLDLMARNAKFLENEADGVDLRVL